jgi:hypothetical protein
MIRRIGLVGALTCAAGLLFAAPGTASAAITLGETFVPANAFTNPSIGLQTQSPGSGYAAPSPGVITSWSYQAVFGPGGVPQGLKLKVGRPAGGSNFTIVGESAPKNPTANQLNTYTDVSIPVQAGDVIGLWPGTAVFEAHFFNSVSGSAGFVGVTHEGDLAPGATDSFEVPSPMSPTYQIDVSAKLEPDADHDGFGDETQDQCATDASTQGACVASPTPPAPHKKCKKKKKHRSAEVAKKKCKKKKRR